MASSWVQSETLSHPGVRCVAFSPGGTLLASGSSNGTLRLWDPSTGKPVDDRLSGHNDAVTSLAFHPDGTLLATGSADGTVRLWNPATGRHLGAPLTGDSHADAVWSVAFSPDGTLLAIGSDDGTVLWDTAARQPVGKPLTPAGSPVVLSVAFDSTSSRLATGSADGTAQLWDPATGKPVGHPLTGHTSGVYSVAFDPTDTFLATGSGAGSLQLWDLRSTEPVGHQLTGHVGEVRSVAFNRDGTLLATGSWDGTVRLWDPATRDPVATYSPATPAPVYSVVFNPAGTLLATAGGEDVRLWWPVDHTDEVAVAPPDVLTGHTDAVWSVAFNPSGTLLASGSWDGTVRLWDPTARQPVRNPLTGHTSPVYSVAFNPTGTLLATGSGDTTARLWDPATCQPVGDPLTGHTGPVYSVAFNPTGTLLATGSRDDTARLWDVPAAETTYLHTMASDDASTQDRLGFEREAAGLARVLAARATEPPLAVALLGEWGAGKSTFMNLLADEIDGLADRAGKDVRTARWLGASPYCPGIRQVRFNAWHYAEDNLWAGIVRKLLGDLASDVHVRNAEAARLDAQRVQVDKELDALDRKLRQARLAHWARRLAVWLVSDEALVDRVAEGARNTYDALATEKARRAGAAARASGQASSFGRAPRPSGKARRLVGLAISAALVLTAVAAYVWLVPALHGETLRSAVRAVVVGAGALFAAKAVVSANLRASLRVAARLAGQPSPKVAELRAQRKTLRGQQAALVQDLDPARRLTRFLQDRQATLDYDPYRGLVSLVHDDLSALSDLIVQQAEAWSANPKAEGVPLERVILYIDDLDRCDPETVVDALRAVHLLFALRIFHVVVAVDARWLLRCLRHHYNTLLDDDTLQPPALLGRHARPTRPATHPLRPDRRSQPRPNCPASSLRLPQLPPAPAPTHDAHPPNDQSPSHHPAPPDQRTPPTGPKPPSQPMRSTGRKSPTDPKPFTYRTPPDDWTLPNDPAPSNVPTERNDPNPPNHQRPSTSRKPSNDRNPPNSSRPSNDPTLSRGPKPRNDRKPSKQRSSPIDRTAANDPMTPKDLSSP